MRKHYPTLLAATMLLAACGGGGADSSSPAQEPPTAISNDSSPQCAPGCPAPTPVSAPPAQEQPPAPPPASAPPAQERPPVSPPVSAPWRIEGKLLCAHRGVFEPYKVIIEGPGRPWSKLKAQSQGESYYLDGAGQPVYSGDTFKAALVDDPNGEIAASGAYLAEGTTVFVGEDQTEPTYGGPPQATYRTAYTVDGNQVTEMVGFIGRDGPIYCRPAASL